MNAEDLVGSYVGRGQQYVAKDGTVRRPIATSARIVYTPEGLVMAVSTPVERAVVGMTESVVAYAGRYDIKDGKVRHHIEVSLIPDLVGRTLMRTPSFEGNRLTLTADPDAEGGVQKIHWERLGAA